MRRSEKAKANTDTLDLSTSLSTTYSPAPDYLFNGNQEDVFDVPEKSYEEAERDLIKFVEEKIDMMKSNLTLGGSDSPKFMELNAALMEYPQVQYGLIALHAKAKFDFLRSNEEYDNFWAAKYMEVRAEQANLGKQGYTNVKDIEYLVRNKYMNQLAALKAKQIEAEGHYNLINYLISGWDKYSFVLNTLSANARAEANADSISRKNPYEFGDE